METHRYKPYTRNNIHNFAGWQRVPEEIREATRLISTVLPFRTNEYVLSNLIDWENVPGDPIFRLNFPHVDMLHERDYAELASLVDGKADASRLGPFVNELRMRMNPHPAGQMTDNVPVLDGERLDGLQHKYQETVLFFPSAGQTCHAYCTFCFRWPQFVGMEDLKFSATSSDDLVRYLKTKPRVTDVLVTGGDPLVMTTRNLAGYLEPLLDPALEHVQTIRIGTKSVAYWPHRFVSDADADDLLRLFERIVRGGKHLSIMGHYNHPAELRTEVAQAAVKRITSTGAAVRMQSPLIRRINDDPRAWAELWKTGVKLGAVPYYMFVERDTGPKSYFDVPLHRAHEIFSEAYRSVSGLARTVRGPSMSAHPGKVVVDGVVDVNGERVFALRFLQARKAEHVGRPFFARFDPTATWLTDLKPAFGQDRFFFEPAKPAESLSFAVPEPVAV